MSDIIVWFRKWFAQDDFESDWYGWLTNQISHISLGVFCAMVTSAAWFYIDGEFPRKIAIWLVLLAGYVALECVRNWVWLDSLEDTVFFAGYGVGGSVLVFTEATPGSPVLFVSVSDVLPLIGIAVGHLAWGVYMRVQDQ